MRAPERLIEECAAQWNLTLEARVGSGPSLVLPAGDAVLKLVPAYDREAAGEADALERWAGVGAVRLLARDDERNALLLERCRPGDLAWDDGNDWLAVVEDVLPRLPHDPGPDHPFPLLVDEAKRWAGQVSAAYEAAGAPFERSLLDFALDVFASVDPGAGLLVNQDLHGANIHRAEREPWLAIDPKPLVGEREIDGVGLLRNAAWRGIATDCLDLLGDLGYDRERSRAWGVAHALAWGHEPGTGWSEQHLAAARAIRAA